MVRALTLSVTLSLTLTLTLALALAVSRHLDLRRPGDGDPRQRLGGGDQQVTRGGGVPTEAVTHRQLEHELAIGRQERGRDAHARRVRGLGEQQLTDGLGLE